jgi:hypothetical protein
MCQRISPWFTSFECAEMALSVLARRHPSDRVQLFCDQLCTMYCVLLYK